MGVKKIIKVLCDLSSYPSKIFYEESHSYHMYDKPMYGSDLFGSCTVERGRGSWTKHYTKFGKFLDDGPIILEGLVKIPYYIITLPTTLIIEVILRLLIPMKYWS